MARCNCYESANQLAEYNNKIREYIQQLASAGAANMTDNAINVQTKEKLTTMGGQDQEAYCRHCRHGRKDDQQQEPGPQQRCQCRRQQQLCEQATPNEEDK
jgi:hypothetical protein